VYQWALALLSALAAGWKWSKVCKWGREYAWVLVFPWAISQLALSVLAPE